MEPELSFIERVSEQSHQKVRRCYYCLRCSAGCPAAEFMEYTPAQLLRLVQLGQKEAVLGSSAIWLCIGCETCGTRCPNEIHAGAVIDALRRIALAEGVTPAERSVYKLHVAFLDSIRWWGRLHELSMLLQHKLTSGDNLLNNLDMGLDMFLKGKIHPLPKRIKGREEVQKLFEMEGDGGGAG
ncbi:MAG TPA: 4Fe-4S dicluster domain-containing protein [Anaerolineae bacterium]|nr:4Fe-4S dicluster domain-containing protein [Anaerolineae bacterium]